jgi:hypothetical protein
MCARLSKRVPDSPVWSRFEPSCDPHTAYQRGDRSRAAGFVVCRNYRFVRAQALPNENFSVTQKGRAVEVEPLNSSICQAGGSVTVVDRRRTTHRLENAEASRYGSVSLHVYSKPIDSAVLFDEASRCCARRRMQYYSVLGSILGKPSAGEEHIERAAA